MSISEFYCYYFYKNLYEVGGESESDTAFYDNTTKINVP